MTEIISQEDRGGISISQGNTIAIKKRPAKIAGRLKTYCISI